MRRQNEKHNLCVRLCFFDAKYEKKWDHAHARIAGNNITSRGGVHNLAIHTHARIAGLVSAGVVDPRLLAIHTHARIAGLLALLVVLHHSLAIHTHARIAGGGKENTHERHQAWQSTPTRELRVRYCESQGKYYRLAIHTHARIAGAGFVVLGNTDQLAIHTHARIAGPDKEILTGVVNWQSTPTRKLRGNSYAIVKGAEVFVLVFFSGSVLKTVKNTASPAIRRGNTLRRPFTDGGVTHCLRRAWSVWDMPCPSMVCENKGK